MPVHNKTQELRWSVIMYFPRKTCSLGLIAFAITNKTPQLKHIMPLIRFDTVATLADQVVNDKAATAIGDATNIINKIPMNIFNLPIF